MRVSSTEKSSRRRAILEALAQQLETSPGERITTASLAAAVGVSEAALYRHFASKAQMFDGLMEFVEESVFGLVNRILADEREAVARCDSILRVLLTFASRNPGITRLLTGDALIGEAGRLRERTQQFFGRLETQLKQVLREGGLGNQGGAALAPASAAQLMLSVAAGRMLDFVQSGFKRSPLADWDAQWAALRRGIFLR